MSETVYLRFKYTEEEWAAATRLYLMAQPVLLLRLVVIFLLIAVCIFMLGLVVDFDTTLLLLSMTVIPLSLLISLFFVFPRQRFRSDPKYRDEFSLEFTEEGIRFQTAQIDSRLNWSLYNRVLENERFYVLIYGKGMISVIPKRAFTTTDEQTTFRRLLRRKLGHTSGSRWLKELPANELESAYVPPAEPPDWR